MTTDELDKLTPEQKQSRIAELHGWTEIKGRFGRAPDGSGVNYTPDYLNDLNASHEMEKGLPLDGHTYWVWIDTLDRIIQENPIEWVGHVASATATQRADAFLLVMG